MFIENLQGLGLSEWHEIDLLREPRKQREIAHHGARIHQSSRLKSANGGLRRRFRANMEELQRLDKPRSYFAHSLAGAGGRTARNQNL